MINRKLFMGLTLATPFCVSSFASTGSKIRVGQVGLKHPHAFGKLKALKQLSETYEIVGVVEPDTKLREKVKGVNWLTEKQLLDEKQLDLVVVETDVKDIAKIGIKFAQKGCHLHLDKPAGTNLKDLQDLFKISNRKKLIIQLGYVLRYNPVFQFMSRAVRGGWFGDILEIDASMGKRADQSLRHNLGQYRGGGFFELAGNILDPVISILGKPNTVLGVNKQTKLAMGDRLPDHQLGILEYDKAIVTLRCNHNDPFGFARRRFSIFGTHGGMDIHPLESGSFTLYLEKDQEDFQKGVRKIQLPHSNRSYARDFQDLAQCIAGKSKFNWSPEHDLVVQKTLIEISESGINE